MTSKPNPIKKENSEMLRAPAALPENLGNRATIQVEGKSVPSFSMEKGTCFGPHGAPEDMVVTHETYKTVTWQRPVCACRAGIK